MLTLAVGINFQDHLSLALRNRIQVHLSTIFSIAKSGLSHFLSFPTDSSIWQFRRSIPFLGPVVLYVCHNVTYCQCPKSYLGFMVWRVQGGMPGSVRLRDSAILQRITVRQAEEKRLYGAICAAPAVVLMPWGLHKRKKVVILWSD